MKKRVALVFGGRSVEHEISILSTLQVLAAIDQKKYECIPILQTKSGEFVTGKHFNKLETFRSNLDKAHKVFFYTNNNKVYLKRIYGIKKQAIDVVLLVVHGKNVEDGNLYGFFKTLGCALTSCEPLAASILQNKHATKIFLSSENIPVLPYRLIKEEEWKYTTKDKMAELKQLNYPIIIKSLCLGSSIGIYKASTPYEASCAIIEAFRYDNKVLIEKCLPNYKEYNQAVIIGEKVIPSLIEEVRTTNDFLTFEDKYQNKTEISPTRIIDPNISEELKDRITMMTLKIVEAFNPKSVIRVDYLYDEDEDQLYVNEVNTIPGSLAFYLFEDKGIYFTELLDTIIETALRDKYKEDLKITTFKSNVLFDANITK